MQFDTDIASGLQIYSGDPNSVTPVAALLPTARMGRGWCYLHVLIAAHATDAVSLTMKGRLNANGGYVSLNKQDHSTACTVAQADGAATEVITTVELLPDMKVSFNNTGTAGASVKVWLEAIGKAARADS